jgi:hypothetical protein
MADFLTLVMKAETEGLDTWAEHCRYAQGLIDTGLVNSTGSAQRFVRDMIRGGVWTPGAGVPCIVDAEVDGATFDECMCPTCARMAADHPTVMDEDDDLWKGDD